MFSFTAVRCVPIGRKKPYQAVTFGPPVTATAGGDAKQKAVVQARYTQFDRPPLGVSAAAAAAVERDGTPAAGPCRVSELLITGPASSSSSSAQPKADSPRPRWEKEYGRRFGCVSPSADGQWVLLVRRYTELWMWHVRSATLTSVAALVDDDDDDGDTNHKQQRRGSRSRRSSRVGGAPASSSAAPQATAPAVPDASDRWRVLQGTLAHDASTALWLVAPAGPSSSASSSSSNISAARALPSHPPAPLTLPSAAAAVARTRAVLWYRGAALSAADVSSSSSPSSSGSSGVSDAQTRSLLRALELDAGSALVVPALELARAGLRLDDPLALAFGATSVTPYCNATDGSGWIVSQSWLAMRGDAAAATPTYPHHAQCVVIAQLRIAMDFEPIDAAAGAATTASGQQPSPLPRCRVTYWPYPLCVHPLLPPHSSSVAAPTATGSAAPPVCLFGTVAHSAVFRDRCVLMRWDHTGTTLALAINTWNAAGARIFSFVFRPPSQPTATSASAAAGASEAPVQRMTEHVHYASSSLGLDVSDSPGASSHRRQPSGDSSAAAAAAASSPLSRTSSASEPPTPRGPPPTDVSTLAAASATSSSSSSSSVTAASAGVPPWWVADLSWWPTAGACSCSGSDDPAALTRGGSTLIQPCSIVMCDGRVLTALLHGHGSEGTRLLDVSLYTRGLLRAAPKAAAPKPKHALALAASPDALPKRAVSHHMLPPNPAHPQLSERRYSLSVALPSSASPAAAAGRLLLSDGFVVAEYTLAAPSAADYFTAQLQAALIHPLSPPLPAVVDVWRASVATCTGFAIGSALAGSAASLFGALLVALMHFTDPAVAAAASAAAAGGGLPPSGTASAGAAAAAVNTSAVVWSPTAAGAAAAGGGTPPLSSQSLRARKQQQPSSAADAPAAPSWQATEQLVFALCTAPVLCWSAPGRGVHEPTVQLVVEVVDRLIVHTAAAAAAAANGGSSGQDAAAAVYRCLRMAEATFVAVNGVRYSFDDQWLALHALLARITPSAMVLHLDPLVSAVTAELHTRGLVAPAPPEPRVLLPSSPSRAAARETKQLADGGGVASPSPLWIEARALYHAGRWAECERVVEQLGDAYVWALLPLYLHQHTPHKVVELVYRIMGTCTRPSRALMSLPPANFLSADQLAAAAFGSDSDTPATRQWGPILAVLTVGRALAAYFTGQPLRFRAPAATCPDTLHAVLQEPTPLQCVDFRWRVCVDMLRATPQPLASPSKYPPSAASAPFASSSAVPASPSNKAAAGTAGGWWTVTRCVDCLLWCHMDTVATDLLPPAIRAFISAAAATARSDTAASNPARNWLAFHRVDRDLKLPPSDYAPDFAVRAAYTRDELARQELARKKADDAARKHAEARERALRTPTKGQAGAASAGSGPLLSPNRVSQGTQTPPAARVPPALMASDPNAAQAVMSVGAPTTLVAEGTDAPDWGDDADFLPLVPALALPATRGGFPESVADAARTCVGSEEVGALAGCAHCIAALQPATAAAAASAGEAKYGPGPVTAPQVVVNVGEAPASPAPVTGNISHVTVFVPPSAAALAAASKAPTVAPAVQPAAESSSAEPEPVGKPSAVGGGQSATDPQMAQAEAPAVPQQQQPASRNGKVLSERGARRMADPKRREKWLADADDEELERQRAALEATSARIEQMMAQRREQAARLHRTQQAAATTGPQQPPTDGAGVWSAPRGNMAVRSAQQQPAGDAPRDVPEPALRQSRPSGQGAGVDLSGSTTRVRREPSAADERGAAAGNIWGTTKPPKQQHSTDRRGSAPPSSSGGGAIWSATGVGTRTVAPPQLQLGVRQSSSSTRVAAPDPMPSAMPGTAADDVRPLASASIPQFASVTVDLAMALRVDTGHGTTAPIRRGITGAKPFQPLPDSSTVAGVPVLATAPTTTTWARVDAANSAPPGAAVNGQAWSSSIGAHGNMRPVQQQQQLQHQPRPFIPPLAMPTAAATATAQQQPPNTAANTKTLAVPTASGRGTGALGGTGGAESVWDVSEMGDASTHPLGNTGRSPLPPGSSPDATGDLSVGSAVPDDDSITEPVAPAPAAPGRSAAPAAPTEPPRPKQGSIVAAVKLSPAGKLLAAALANGAPPGNRGFRRSFAPLPGSEPPLVTSLDRQDAAEAQKRAQRAERTRMEEAARKLRADVEKGVGNFDEFHAALADDDEAHHPHAGRGVGPLSFPRLDPGPQRAKAGVSAGAPDVLHPEALPHSTDDTPTSAPLKHVRKPSLKPGLRKPPRSLSVTSGSSPQQRGAASADGKSAVQADGALVRFVLPQHQMLYPHADDEFGPDSDRSHHRAATNGVSVSANPPLSPVGGDEKAPELARRGIAAGKRGSAPPIVAEPAFEKRTLPDYITRSEAGPIAQALFFVDPKRMRELHAAGGAATPDVKSAAVEPAPQVASVALSTAASVVAAADVKHSPAPVLEPLVAVAPPSSSASRVLDELPGTEPAPLTVTLTSHQHDALQRMAAHEQSGAAVDAQLRAHAAREAPAVRAALADHPFHPALPHHPGAQVVHGEKHSPTRRATGPWPAQMPLRHELRAVDADLTALERRASDIRAQLAILPPDQPNSPQHKRVAAAAAAHDSDTLEVGKKLLSQLDALLTESGEDADAAAAAAAASASAVVPAEHRQLAADVARTLADVAEDSYDG